MGSTKQSTDQIQGDRQKLGKCSIRVRVRVMDYQPTAQI